MAPRVLTEARSEFLSDIIIGAVEGGIGYWSQCSHYQWFENGKRRRVTGANLGDQTCAVVHVLKDDESGYELQGLRLDPDAVERGLKLIREGGCQLDARLRNRLIIADRSDDAGQLDAFDCDVIVQAGLLGEIVYA